MSVRRTQFNPKIKMTRPPLYKTTPIQSNFNRRSFASFFLCNMENVGGSEQRSVL